MAAIDIYGRMEVLFRDNFMIQRTADAGAERLEGGRVRVLGGCQL